MNPTASMT